MPTRFPFDDWSLDEIEPIIPYSVRMRRNRSRFAWALAWVVGLVGMAVIGLVILNG